MNMGEPFISSPADTIRDAKAFDKWDKENSDREQRMPELSSNPKANRILSKEDIMSNQMYEEYAQEEKRKSEDSHLVETFDEIDPNGKSANEPGAKLDSNKPEMELVITGFPRALEEVGKVATFGKKKYSRGGWKTVPNGDLRYTSALIRHMLANAKGEKIDSETGLTHLGAIAWNALAILELELSK